jgi:hypothetical protein
MSGKDKSVRVAETDFNLAKYCETQTITDQLALHQSESFSQFTISPEDYVEVVIKTQILDSDGTETPRKTPAGGLTPVSTTFSKGPGELKRRE